MNENVPFFIGKRFSSFKEFEGILVAYEKHNNVKYVTSTSCSIKNENKKLAEKGHQLYAENLLHKNILFKCKFSDDVRIRSGKGERPLQSTFKIGCTSLIHLVADSKTKGHLFVKNFVPEHKNHNCLPEEIRIIPECRIVHEEDAGTVETLLQANVRPSTIRLILRDTQSGMLTARDIANLKAKRRRDQLHGRSEVQMLTDTLCDLMDEDPGTFIHITKDSDHALESLFIMTSRMKQNVINFGMVVLFDHTYKINKNRLPVSIFKVSDGNGLGRCAGIGYVVNEEKVTITNIVAAFKEAIGDEIAMNIRTMVIDKDYSEAGAIENILPHVAIQLCNFHVGNTFKTRTAKESPEVKATVDDMRYCDSDDKFQELADELKEYASEAFYKYFEKNWINCPLAWSFRDKKKSPHLGNTTTGKLENFNSKIKMMLDGDTPLYESVHILVQLVANREEDVLYRDTAASLKYTYLTTTCDEITTRMLNEITLYAAKKILAEKKLLENGVAVKESTSTSSCSCTLFIHTFLPCAHILQIRVQKGLSWYDIELIPEMYRKLKGTAVSESSSQNVSRVIAKTAPSKLVPKTGPEKYNRAMTKAKQLCAVLSECGEAQFGQRYQILIDLLKLWSQGDEVMVVKIVAENVMNAIDAASENDVANINRPLAPTTSASIVNNIEDAPITNDNDGSSLIFTPSTDLTSGNSDIRSTTQPLMTIQLPLTARLPSITKPPSVDAASENFVVNINRLLAPTTSSPKVNNVEDAPIIDDNDGSSLSVTSSADLRNGNNDITSTTQPLMTTRLPLTSQLPSITKPPSKNMQGITRGSSGDPPQCFCGFTCIRLVASAASKRPGRSFYKCPRQQGQCRFFRMAKSQITNTPIQTASHSQLDVSTLLDDDSDTMLNLLVNEIEAMECNKSVSHSQNSMSASEVLRDALQDLTVPESVKHRGRPKGLHKTVNKLKETKGRKRKPLTLVSLEERQQQNAYKRRKDGETIQDADVSVSGPGAWCVQSQTETRVSYSVMKSFDACSCAGPACENCLECSCKDYTFRKRPCKHIFKVFQMLLNREHEHEQEHVKTKRISSGAQQLTEQLCGVCQLPGVSGLKCFKCKVPIHKEDCSHEITGKSSDDRLCMMCAQREVPTETFAKKRLSLGICATQSKSIPIWSVNTAVKSKPEVINLIDDDDDDVVFIRESIKEETIAYHSFGDSAEFAVTHTDMLADLEVQNNTSTGCVACAKGYTPSAHTCTVCGKAVHLLEECSLPIHGEEEGYGEKRVCRNCYQNSGATAALPIEYCVCGKEGGSHKCTKCGSSVHAIPPCSQAAPGSAEGYGEARICRNCIGASVPSTSPSQCCVCLKEAVAVAVAVCITCTRKCHLDTQCSVPNCSKGRPNEISRICRLCICNHCKLPNVPPHTCRCVVCMDPTFDFQLCSNCVQPIHCQNECSITIGASSDDNDIRWCRNCMMLKDKGVPVEDINVLLSDEMVADSTIQLAQRILQEQFPEVQGLAQPIQNEASLLRSPPAGENHRTYVPSKKENAYIQILNTGHDHWVTCYKARNVGHEINVLNSSGALVIGSFVEQQLALILNTEDPQFTVAYCKVKSQEEGVNQCGPLAIAIATELAFEKKITFVDFKLSELRSHLMKCLFSNKMERFPREGDALASKRLKVELVDVCCFCRLPYHYDTQLVMCGKCREWCHYKCNGLTTKPRERRWLCRKCQQN